MTGTAGALLTIREARPDETQRVAAFLEVRGMREVARLGELIDPLAGRSLVAVAADGETLGVLTLGVDGEAAEVTTLYAAEAGLGIGTGLLAAAEEVARAAGCRRLWLVTTNDNLDALRFYQRRGLRLAALHPGAVDAARATLKSAIPEIGEHGIPLRDELVLEKRL